MEFRIDGAGEKRGDLILGFGAFVNDRMHGGRDRHFDILLMTDPRDDPCGGDAFDRAIMIVIS